MTIPKIDICCSKCHVVLCSSSNEWKRLEDVSLITPVQKTWLQTITIAKAQGFLPLEPVPADLHNDIVSEATCAKCGSVLGQGFGDVFHEDPIVNSEQIYFVDSAVILKNSDTPEEVSPIVTENVRKDMLRAARSSSQDRVIHDQTPTVSSPVQTPCQEQSQTLPAGQEVEKVLSRFTQQDMGIKKLSRDLESLQNRMLALEKSMTDIRTYSRAASIDGPKSGRDMFIDNFEAMFDALKDARSAAITIEGLRSENEQLKQRLSYSAAPTISETQNEPSESVVETASDIPITGALEPVKEKRSYIRRKPLASRKSTTRAAPGSLGPESGFASNHDEDDASYIDSLTALNQISAAMAPALSTSQAQSGASNQHFSNHLGEESASLLSNANYIPAIGENILTTQPRKRRRTGDMLPNREDLKSYATKTRGATHAADLSSDSGSRYQSREPLQIKAESSTSQETGLRPSIATQLQNAADSFNIASTDKMMIDPALRSTGAPANPNPPALAVLSSIENPPAQRQPMHPAPQARTVGGPQHESDQERRIREYKARDALRKRKARAASTGKKKIVGEERFKQEEKIRARDKMVRELMEREEMLENDSDL
ncbi:hypothetical protein EPUS_04692 [Endocarpon pusillum Z07020]|uniref:Yippee domain-containing protein n=1 Tax=Endocarpon pusillum (strain Z07020 / HMAS-L-300199) TaxID=1263415 RepID=U1HI87_ENDPU|nr:uncharacterized protein EPUS_04692 [Endocarpon pusillum Z07020]ERF68594.1 hypothetical protein EPUS_04692 [Endocarpon pusillum Z07020]